MVPAPTVTVPDCHVLFYSIVHGKNDNLVTHIPLLAQNHYDLLPTGGRRLNGLRSIWIISDEGHIVLNDEPILEPSSFYPDGRVREMSVSKEFKDIIVKTGTRYSLIQKPGLKLHNLIYAQDIHVPGRNNYQAAPILDALKMTLKLAGLDTGWVASEFDDQRYFD